MHPVIHEPVFKLPVSWVSRSGWCLDVQVAGYIQTSGDWEDPHHAADNSPQPITVWLSSPLHFTFKFELFNSLFTSSNRTHTNIDLLTWLLSFPSFLSSFRLLFLLLFCVLFFSLSNGSCFSHFFIHSFLLSPCFPCSLNQLWRCSHCPFALGFCNFFCFLISFGNKIMFQIENELRKKNLTLLLCSFWFNEVVIFLNFL